MEDFTTYFIQYGFGALALYLVIKKIERLEKEICALNETLKQLLFKMSDK